MKKLILISLLLSLFLIVGCKTTEPLTNPSVTGGVCIKEGTGEMMEFSEANAIAMNSDCVKLGNLKENHMCNESTGTWLIDLNITKQGCNPACVINIETQEVTINWRCTGLLP